MLRATLEQWRMFKCVVDYGGFNQASQAIHKSQSSIHHAVQKLENSLGVKLLEVKGRKAFLTSAGEMMLRRANYLLDEAAKLEAIADGLKVGTETYLKIAVDEIFPRELLYKVLDTVSAEFPLLRIELMESVLTGGKELLEKNQVDIAITPMPIDNGFAEELCVIDFVAVASPEHDLHNKDVVTYEDLKSCRQIVVRDSAVGASENRGWLGSNQRWTVSHLDTSIDMISKGFGFAWLPLPLIADKLQNQTLKQLPLEHGVNRTGPLFLVFKDGDKLGPAARSFLGELRYQSQNMPTTE